MVIEQWRPISGYRGRYEISETGAVRSMTRRWSTPKILKPTLSSGGYLFVSLYQDGVDRKHRINVLVATAWHGARPMGQVCRHLDGNKLNNTPQNLAWGTYSENGLDCVRHGTHPEASKTHCVMGHPYDEANTYWRASRGRQCRACRTRWANAKTACDECGLILSRCNLSPHKRRRHGARQEWNA